MHLIYLLVIGLFTASTSHSSEAATAQKHNNQPYAGQEQREIKSLSTQDIDDLEKGRGWGLAKAAELNGVPGPSHLLELQREIGLSKDQVSRVEHLFDGMKKDAIPLGRQMIVLERRLNDGFAKGQMTDENLKTNLAEISDTLSVLRYVHLTTHLKTVKILNQAQIQKYNQLRGYAASGANSRHSINNKHIH